MVGGVAVRGHAGARSDVVVKAIRGAACSILVDPDLVVPQRSCSRHVLRRLADDPSPFRLNRTHGDPVRRDRRRGRNDRIPVPEPERLLASESEEGEVERAEMVSVALRAADAMARDSTRVPGAVAGRPVLTGAEDLGADVVAERPPGADRAGVLEEPAASVALGNALGSRAPLAPGLLKCPSPIPLRGGVPGPAAQGGDDDRILHDQALARPRIVAGCARSHTPGSCCPTPCRS